MAEIDRTAEGDAPSPRDAQGGAADAASLEPQEPLDLDPSWAEAEDTAQVNADDTEQPDDYAHTPTLTKAPAPTRTPARAVDYGVRIDPIAAPSAERAPKRTMQRAAPPPNQRVHDIAAFLTDVDARRTAGRKVGKPRPIREVLGAYAGSPIDQTRIQVLAAAAAARHLEGPESATAQRLNKLAADNDARLDALRVHERRTAALEHSANETPKADIAAYDEERIEQQATNDRRVFDAAAAVALGYVAERGLPAVDQLDRLSESQLGPVPDRQKAEPSEHAPAKGGPSSVEKTKELLDSVGRGLAQAVGPVVGDDDVAPNLSPVNVAALGDELANLVKSLAPAMKAAMSSHPRSIKDILNVEHRPDEQSEIAFEQESELDRERDFEHAL